jgi:hypothetical protein
LLILLLAPLAANIRDLSIQIGINAAACGNILLITPSFGLNQTLNESLNRSIISSVGGNASQLNWQQFGVILLSLASCLSCILIVFWYSSHVRMSPYLRDSLVEIVKQQEFEKLLLNLQQEAENYGLDPENYPPPDEYATKRL